MMRVACLLVSDLPLRAELRAHPEHAGRPLAVSAGAEPRSEIVSLSPEAIAAGVRLPSSVARARSACAKLAVCVASPALERAARETLLDVALSFSPRAALAPPATGIFASEACVFLDASGMGSLYPSEQGFATALGARAHALGLGGVVAVASSRGVAHLAARRAQIAQGDEPVETGIGAGVGACVGKGRESGDVICIPKDEETRFLAPLPLDLFDLDDRLAQALTLYGIHSVRDLLRLPRRSLAHRLGPDVLQLLARASGQEMDAPLPEPTDTRVEESVDLEYAIDRLEPLDFVLRGMLSRLTERLALRGLASGPLDLRLDLCGGRRDARHVGVAAPTRDVRVLLRLVHLALESQPPGEAVETLSLQTIGVPVRRDQLDLFLPSGPDPAALDRTLAELESLCGPERVGAPAVADDHRPDRFEIRPFPASGRRRSRSTGEHERAPSEAPPTTELPVRALRPPIEAVVRIDAGRPTQIRSALANGDLVQVAGPWRTTGHWWSEDRFAVDHYDAQVSDGTVVRLLYDWVRKRWAIDAVYD